MRTIIVSPQFKRDVKLARKRNLPEDDLLTIVRDLAEDKELPANKHDHALTGNFKGYRECHIHPDWLLIYKKEDGDIRILKLSRTGTHSDLF